MFADLLPSSPSSSRSRNVEAIEIHHLVPRRNEVLHKLLLRVAACVDFRKSAQLRVRAEDQIDARGGPFQLFGLPVASLIDTRGIDGLPFRSHVEQVDEKVVRQLPGLFGE